MQSSRGLAQRLKRSVPLEDEEWKRYPACVMSLQMSIHTQGRQGEQHFRGAGTKAYTLNADVFKSRRVIFCHLFFSHFMGCLWGFPGGSVVNNPLAMQQMQETQFRSRCQEDPLEEGMAIHSSILVWRIP